jgi:hypothetical protein
MTSINQQLYPALVAAVVLMTLVWLVQAALVRRHGRRYQEAARIDRERLEAAARATDARAAADRAAQLLELVRQRGQLLEGRMRQQAATQARALAVVEASRLTATPAA